jgi:hypothetical protein
MRNLLLLILFAAVNAQAADVPKHRVEPKDGLVPNAETAISIAVAVWTPIYGASKLEQERPFVATLKNGVWYVEGSLPKDWVGGVAEAEISKKDARVLRISHGK